jgi:hypothetical protein
MSRAGFIRTKVNLKNISLQTASLSTVDESRHGL